MKNIHDFLTSLFSFSLVVRKDISVDTFCGQNHGLFNSIASEISDEKFPLLKNYSGEMLFCFYKVKEKITDSKGFFEKTIEHGFILPGYQGISVLRYRWRDDHIRGNSKFILPSGWILAPNKVISKESNTGVEIPYFDTIITGEHPHKKYGNIDYYTWSNLEIPAGETILLLRDLNKKSI